MDYNIAGERFNMRVDKNHYILALDTHDARGGIGIASGREIIGLLLFKSKTSHTKRLFKSIEFLLNQLELCIAQIGAFAINRGPGSFTGIRIGISAVKGLAINRKSKIYPFETNYILAHSVRQEAKYIATIVDAGRGEVYFKLFEKWNNQLNAITEHLLLKPIDVMNYVNRGKDDDTILIGTGACKYKELFTMSGFGRIELSSPIFPKVMLEEIMGSYDSVTNIETLDALYIRKADAEIKKG